MTKRAHLRDLFITGKEVSIQFVKDDEEFEAVVWVQKPLVSQQEDALQKSRGEQFRRRRTLQDRNSDEYLALAGDVDTLETAGEVIDRLVLFETSHLRQQAYNEILYDPSISPRDEEGELIYGEEGQLYMDLLDSISARLEEVSTFNANLAEEDTHLRISPMTDEELVKLRELEKNFEDLVEDRLNDLMAAEKTSYKGVTLKNLREKLVRKLIENESTMHWYANYQKRMLFYACRDPEDHTKFYFRHLDDIDVLPGVILIRLQAELDQLSSGQEALKNSLSLQYS